MQLWFIAHIADMVVSRSFNHSAKVDVLSLVDVLFPPTTPPLRLASLAILD